jgi:FixJ family two-component response regulator
LLECNERDRKRTINKVRTKEESSMTRKKLVKGRWSNYELELLRKVFPTVSTRQVADKLGRTVKSVEIKASKMGLKKSKKYLKTIGRA